MDEWTDFLSSRQWKSNAPSPTDLDRDNDLDTTKQKSLTEICTSNTNRLRPYSFEKSKLESKYIHSVVRKVSDKLRKSTKDKYKPFGEATVLLQRSNGTHISDYKIGQFDDRLSPNGSIELNGGASIEVPLFPKPLQQFRRAARTVQILLKAVTSSRQGEQRHGQEYMSFTQIYDEQDTARRTYDLFGISFDPTMFRANREKNLSNEGKVILSMDPSERTEDRLHVAMLALNQTVEAFGEFPIKLQRSLAVVGWYENFEAKRVIIRQGHMADNFYLILSGTGTCMAEASNNKPTYIYTAFANNWQSQAILENRYM